MKVKIIFFQLVFLAITFSATAQYKIGDTVSDFKLPDFNGELISLQDYNSSMGVILIFTCNTCPFAVKYEERIKNLDSEFASKGFPVLAINSNSVVKKPGDSMDAMKERANKLGITFAYLKDKKQRIAKEFGAQRTPEVYVLLNENNSFSLAYTGAIDNNVDSPENADKHYVADAVNALLSKKDVKVKETRAVGCTIKWDE